jgi:hypothetical protein
MLGFGVDLNYIGKKAKSPRFSIPYGGKFTSLQKANDTNIGSLNAPGYLCNFWFKPDLTQNWTGTKCLISVGALVDELSAIESSILQIFINRPTTNSTILYITAYWNIDAFGNYDASYFSSISNQEHWHRFFCYWAPLNGNAGFSIDGESPFLDEFFNYQTIPTPTHNSFQINIFGEYLQGGKITSGMPGAYSEVYFSNSSAIQNLENKRFLFAETSGQPKNIGDGTIITGTAPQIFYKTWDSVGATLTNTGTSDNANVNPANLITVTGPTQWSQP